MKHPLIFCAALTFPLASCVAQPAPRSALQAAPLRLEAENATLSGNAKIATARAGFSGTGYVTGFEKDGDSFTFTIPNAKAGIYNVSVRYSAPGEKGFGLNVNGAKSSGMFKASGGAFALQSAGKVALKAGENTLSLDRGWGFYDIDYIELSPAAPAPALRAVPATLVDKKADAKTRALMKFLVAHYGTTMLSGQYTGDEAYVQQLTGKTPAIAGLDLMDYSPSRVAFGSKSTAIDEAIAHAKKGQIITLSWHWNAPNGLINADYTDKNGKKIAALWWRGFYTNASTFDLEKALANPKSPEYALILSDIDAIAVQLKRLQAAGVPVLWRPLHEAEGAWFWWGAKGPQAFKTLWKLMFNRLATTHNLHNLIWVYTGPSPQNAWYPGDDFVDIYGIDAYPSDRTDPLSGPYDALLTRFNGKKLLALTEFKGVPDAAKMEQFGVKWSFFAAWTGGAGTKSQDVAEVKRTYSHPKITSLDRLKR